MLLVVRMVVEKFDEKESLMAAKLDEEVVAKTA